MKKYIVEGTLQEINYAPASVVLEVLQNVKTLLNTKKYTIVLDRNFGIDNSFIDKPIETAKALFRVSIIEAIRKYEPRAEVLSIEFRNSNDDLSYKITPVVEVKINE